MFRRLAIPFVLVLATVVAGTLGIGSAATNVTSAASVATSAAPTVVRHVRPVGAAGRLSAGYTVAHSHKGHCEAGSEETRDAYRCFAGNRVYDPCWVTSNTAFVVCLGHPWSFTAVSIHVSHYDNSGYSKKIASIPWGVQLGDGQLCGLLAGATSLVHGKRVNYGCQHVKLVLIGNVDKHRKVWRIRKARQTKGGHYKLTGWADVSKAWFGKPSRKG
jgi:hypothetical protein